MPNCSVIGCTSSSGRRFPEDEKLKEKWLTKIKRRGFKPTNNALVCLKHFRSDDFVPDSENRLVKLLVQNFTTRW